MNVQTKEGETALMFASGSFRQVHDQCVTLLLDAGASVNVRNKYGSTALMEAAWR